MTEVKYKCKKCGGTGKCDDAEPGDISFNEWDCEKCNGKGYILEIYDGGVVEPYQYGSMKAKIYNGL